MSVRSSFCVALAAVSILVPCSQGQDFSDVTIGTTLVTEGIYVLSGEGGNIGLCVGPDAAFLIDDQFAPLTEKIKAAIAKVSDKPIRFVVNTHHHGDHTGGNENLRASGSLVIAQETARERMGQTIYNELFMREVPAGPEGGFPDITFDQSVTFHVNGQTIEVVHVPRAHTDGDAFVHFKEADVIHCGDVFFNGMYPFIDTSAGGSIDGLIGAVDSLLARSTETTQLIPGHGPIGNRADLVAYQEMLKESRIRVQKGIDAGTELNEFVLSYPLADFDKPWGKSMLPSDMFVRIVYASLMQQADARQH